MTEVRPGNILVVEDEVNLAEGIRENLQAEGHTVDLAEDGLAGLEKIRRGSYDLVVLDIMMPGMDGLAVCEQARSEGFDVPVLFLTARGSVDDRIRGLKAGGDDYLPKPFNLSEFLLRVEVILRRRVWSGGNTKPPAKVLRFGDNEVDLDQLEGAAWDGVSHRISRKEGRLLEFLALERAGEIVAREEILEAVWGHELMPATRVLDDLVGRLRDCFERDPKSPRHLHTVRGVGYRFQPEDPTR